MKSLLQSKYWANFKKKYGWKIHKVDKVRVFEKKLPFGKSFFYIPEVSSAQHSMFGIKELLKKIKPLAKKRKAVFLRIEPLEEDKRVKNIFKRSGLRRAFEEIQPRFRQWIHLDKPEDKILKEMKSKGRYNIRLAARKGVKIIKSDSPKDIEIFYRLYQETAMREGFPPRPKKYFINLFHELFAKRNGMFFIAMYQGKPISALFVTFYGKIASYLYGGSSARDRNVMAPYLAHWEAIKEAKNRGMKVYDMLAIAPREDQKHKHYGLRRFKKQFGGRQVNLVGGWDKIYSRFWYFWFKIAEKIRRK